ncbi:MAG: FAD-dependent oxidoreductase [Candidatus Iainarchaeum archaeon]|uniref:FAD-dependent oxidoreductase n=1 Tax=Candidatus Iainarchaeum sp. TaxID=3101447 RepID=A0A7T9I1L9_9ARCH|nr:MAG: FAD-dependent oxidoreductase [Candidatus Diapherotrites archaeon]
MGGTRSKKESVVVIGAGITGMSCAIKLGKSAIVLERTDLPGGLCKTDIVKGFVLDHVIHLVHWRNEEVRTFIEKALEHNVNYFNREAYVYAHNSLGKYPIQIYVDAYPKEVQWKCFEGLLDVTLQKEETTAQNYREWLLSKFGLGLCELFFFPYNEKQWMRPLEDIIPAGTTKFTPKASIKEFVRGTFLHEDIITGYNPRFFYPLTGGIESLSKAMAEKIESISYNEEVEEITLSTRTVKTKQGKKINFDYLVSTIPLPKLIQAITDAPSKVKTAATKLSNISEFSLNFGIKGKPPPGQWTYFPEKKYTFSRLSVGSRFSPNMAPKGCYSLWVETFFDPKNKPNFVELKEKITNQLIEIGYIKNKKDIMVCQEVIMPFAYVVYDKEYEENVKIIQDFLQANRIKIAGRFGEWKYTSIEESILDGWRIAKEIQEGK